MRWFAFIGLMAAVLGCPRSESLRDASACECPAPAPVAALAPVAPPPSKPLREPVTHGQHVTPMPVCEAKGRLPLDASRDYYDKGLYEKALSCASQAAALAPNDVLAHTERANSLSALSRYDEARPAYARALAIDPESLDALLGAAHFYAVALPSSRENDELGVDYAEKGFELATTAREQDTALELARIAAMGHNDLGESPEALDRAEWVLSKLPKDRGAAYERAVALFELCRFAEAKKAFVGLVDDTERAAHVHWHLALLLEREGKEGEARVHFDTARALSPEDFSPPILLSAPEFEGELSKLVAALPADMRDDLSRVPIAAEDLPKLADLTTNTPPLSPTILGLFRGPPLNETCDDAPDAGGATPCRSIVVYRKNLARAVKSKEELLEQLRVTLLHEVGHLRGEDDFELAARGLE